MERAGTVTAEGSDFLMAALDPMHDNQLKSLVGWPDLETSASVVRCVKQSITLRKPGSIPAGTNWDMSIVQWPWQTSQTFDTCTRNNNEIVMLNEQGLPKWTCGGLDVYIVPSGAPFNYGVTPDFSLTLSDVYGLGPSRVLGLGIEGINTTSDLAKQGQVFVWRQANSKVTSTGFSSIISNTTVPLTATRENFDGLMISSPPHSTQEAMLIPGTRQWRAEDGHYQVVPHLGQDNPPILVNYTQPVILLTSVPDTPIANSTGLAPSIFNTSILGVPKPFLSVSNVVQPPFIIYPIHQVGAIYVGLSDSTTITLTWNAYIESFPTIAEPDILVLATPSAEYDPAALMMYSHALTVLPVGVPSNWNGFGDWFADVVSTISDFVTPGALALGMPAVSALSAGAGSLAKGYLSTNKSGRTKYLTSASPISEPKPRVKPLPKPPIRMMQQPQKQKARRKGKTKMKWVQVPT